MPQYVARIFTLRPTDHWMRRGFEAMKRAHYSPYPFPEREAGPPTGNRNPGGKLEADRIFGVSGCFCVD